MIEDTYIIRCTLNELKFNNVETALMAKGTVIKYLMYLREFHAQTNKLMVLFSRVIK